MNLINQKALVVATVAVSLSMAGCSSTPKSSTAAAADNAAEVEVLQQEVSSLEDQLSRERAKLQQMQSFETGEQSMPEGVTGALLPPNAQPGECYARVFLPPTYKSETEQVLKSEASEKIATIPAKYEWVEEKVLVKAPSTRHEIVPPTYKTVTEKVLDKPEHTVWKKGSGPISKIDESTGEIMCLVTVPASYKTVSKRVLVEKGGAREIEIPAEYKTVKVRKVAEPAKTMVTPIPAKYDTITKRAKVSEGYIEWRPVLCKTNTTADVVRRIQAALDKAGHNPGPIDGALGGQTMAAVKSYQQAKGLPTGGITMKTLSSLGVNP